MLDRYGFEPTDIQIDPHQKTGVVKVVLKGAGIPSFQIFPDVAYDYLQLDHLADDPIWQEVTLIYYGSLIQRSDIGFKQLGRLLSRRHKGMKCFCDINLRVPHYSRSTILQSLTYADILKLNDQELDEIRHILDNPASSGTFAEYLIAFFNIEMLAITRGAEGSTLITKKRTMDVPPAPLVDIIDTVGAGDGYAAMLVLGTFFRLPLETIAATTTDFAAKICQLPGAVPEDAGFYDEWKIRLGEYL